MPQPLKEMGELLKEGLSRRFQNIEKRELIGQAMFLDPRFLKKVFQDESDFKTIHRQIKEKIRNMRTGEQSFNEQEQHRHNKKPSHWDEFDQDVIKSTTCNNPEASAIIEIDKYLKEPLIQQSNDPFKWWEERKPIYSRLYDLMLRRLCIPATSVP
ncbi:hypothetical protein AVEN_69075-1 [Araneus ventricosus]|uniref:HAT C-terminal dimerisation domain-containing protein n=1 Tax=Araneus ventricosus TaxID=182803 RepID=A0A4Y2SV68_ARAVE|nr:hypothetical protein AVEN_69075-1 [Araneus ventricosus]